MLNRPGAGSQEYVLRRYRSGEMDAVRAVELAAYMPADVQEDQTYTYADAAKLADMFYPSFFFAQAGHVFGGGLIVAAYEENGETLIAGYILAVVDAEDPTRGWILSLAVHPDHQRKGLGGKLTDAAEEYLSGRSCKKVYLTVDPDNTVAHQLYLHHKFVEEDRIENYFSGENGARLEMAKQLVKAEA
jgi:ribosomal protein S18 acetylase RimI-like enzyme